MSTLKFEKLTIPSADFGGQSSVAPISEEISKPLTNKEMMLDESDGLYVNYGNYCTSYPYRYQNMYDRSLNPVDYDIAVLENENLKATFMPGLGGKLWSLIDKHTGKDLLFANDVVRPCNLAIRNAWTSGGVEWNCGFKGHHPYTCSTIATYRTSLADGTPVLRFSYFERVRAAVVQMDFFLPDGAKLLYCRMRITNPMDEVVPMYWWSNVAVPSGDDCRVIVPAVQSYTAARDGVVKVDIPELNGIDVTYPTRNIISIDYFWKTIESDRKYICQLNKDGYGLCQTSTSRLKGRKLFVWGDSQGGHRWQNFLSSDNNPGSYAEIQSGIANTQYECLPMPPRTTWEWLEGYGAMKADPAAVHGEWSGARAEAEARLESMISESDMEELLANTLDMAKSPAERVYGSDGWASLERERRKKAEEPLMCNHLDFGEMDEEQADWYMLLTEGTVGEHNPIDIPLSYMSQKQWIDMLETAIDGKDRDNWYAHYLLGTYKVAVGDLAGADKCLTRSLELAESPWALHALGVLKLEQGKDTDGADYMCKAYSLRPGDVSLAKDMYRTLHNQEMSDKIITMFEADSTQTADNLRCKLYYAYALARVGRISDAEKIILTDDGYMTVPDVREGELTVTALWYYINELKGGSPEDEPPIELDFRMSAKRKDFKL